MATGVRDLKVWQESVTLAGEVIRAMRHAGRRETKVVSDRLMQTAILVALRIAEGYGRPSAGEQAAGYRAARVALVELETELAVARQGGLITAELLSQLTGRVNSVTRMLAGYQMYVERQVAAEVSAGAAGAAMAAVAR
jgi:four helix bundle protein